MPKFIVQIPIAGSVTFEVVAADKRAAKEAAWAAVDSGVEGDIEWEYLDSVTEGNVLHAPLNEVSVMRVRDDDERGAP